MRKETEMNQFEGDKFFYPVRGSCLSKCKVKKDDTRIGSCLCQKCDNIIESDQTEHWIKCSVIEKAVGLNSQAVINKKK